MTPIKLLVATLLLTAGGRAAGLEHGTLSINGSGGWAYGLTSSGNSFDMGTIHATPEGEFGTAEFNLTVTAKPAARITMAAMLSFAEAPDGSTAGMDWAFAEYSFSDALKLRAGKVKLPFGLSQEVQAVGTLRPFYDLPPSVYGPASMVSDAYLGLGLTGAVYLSHESGWGIAYDAYGGLLKLETTEPFQRLTHPTPGVPVTLEREDARDLIGGRITLLTPLEGLLLRASGYRGLLEVFGTLTVGVLSAEYTSEVWSLKAELYRSVEAERQTGAYLEVARHLTDRWQVAVLGEIVATRAPGVPDDSQFLRHRQVAIGLNCWVTAGLVVKVAAHYIQGNRLAFPPQLEEAISAGGVNDETRLLTAGVQFSF